MVIKFLCGCSVCFINRNENIRRKGIYANQMLGLCLFNRRIFDLYFQLFESIRLELLIWHSHNTIIRQPRDSNVV